jgi:hypothetical protein
VQIDLPLLCPFAQNASGNQFLVWLVTHKHNLDTPFYDDFNCITPNKHNAPCLEFMKMVLCLYSQSLSVDLGHNKCTIYIHMKGQFLLIKLSGPHQRKPNSSITKLV